MTDFKDDDPRRTPPGVKRLRGSNYAGRLSEIPKIRALHGDPRAGTLSHKQRNHHGNPAAGNLSAMPGAQLRPAAPIVKEVQKVLAVRRNQFAATRAAQSSKPAHTARKSEWQRFDPRSGKLVTVRRRK